MYSVPIRLLSPKLIEAWRAIHDEADRSLGPFLHPEYARSVGTVRPDVEVAVLTQGAEAVGFLPFQRTRLGLGTPVGSRLCDLSGVVQRHGASWDPIELVRAAGLQALRLGNVPTALDALSPYLGRTQPASFIDLEGGFDAYLRLVSDSGSSLVRQVEAKASRLARDHGPLRFEWHTTEVSAHHALMAWKAEQRRATRTPDVLSLAWARALVDRLRGSDAQGFAGVLSALWAGDVLVAAHLGLRTRHVLHYWIPAYNGEFGRYSPGLVCLMRVARAAAERGIQRLDLGPGEESYKARAATGSRLVATATVSTGRTVATAIRCADAVRTWSRGSRVGGWVRASGRVATRGSYLLRAALQSIGDRQARTS